MNTLEYIEQQIAHHGAQLEKYMIAKAVLAEAAKARGVSYAEPKKAVMRGPQNRNLRQTILDQMAANGSPMMSRDIINALGMDAKPVWRMLFILKRDGLITQDAYGRYALVSKPKEEEIAA
jgi:hypothetical protein